MAKRQTKEDKIINARIQSAITGLQIPMMTIPVLSEYAKRQIANGATDDELRQAIVLFLFVTEEKRKAGK